MKKIFGTFVILSLFALSCTGQKGEHKPLMGGISPSEQKSVIDEKTNTDNDENADVGSGESLELPAIKNGEDDQILRRTAYTASYNSTMLQPNWVAWHLTADHTNGTYSRKNIGFHEDEEVDEPRALGSDYRRSGYDRGHMCPAGDNKWNMKALTESFLMTNICPQNHALNIGVWNNLEEQCRTWARQFGDIYIAAGPIFNGKEQKRIGKNGVAVPSKFFKVLLVMGDKPAAIGYIFDNADLEGDFSSFSFTVDEVEKATGLDFFASLPDEIERRVESEKGEIFQ